MKMFFKHLFIKYSTIINNLHYFLVEFRWLYCYIIIILLFILSIDLYLLLNITDNYDSISTNVCNYCINNFDYIKSNDNLFYKFLDLFSNKGKNHKGVNFIKSDHCLNIKPYSNDTVNNFKESGIINMLFFRLEVKNEVKNENINEFIEILKDIINELN